MDKECNSAPKISFCFLFFIFETKLTKQKTQELKALWLQRVYCSLNPLSCFCMRMSVGLQLTLSKNQLHPLQLLVLIVFSPAFHGERVLSWFQSPAPFRSEKQLVGRLFIPVLRENQAPKPGAGTLGLHGL